MSKFHHGKQFCVPERLAGSRCAEAAEASGGVTFQVAPAQSDEPRGDEVMHVWSSGTQRVLPIMPWEQTHQQIPMFLVYDTLI